LPGPKQGEPWTVPAGRWPANVILTDPIFDGGWDGVIGGGEVAASKVTNGNRANAGLLDSGTFGIHERALTPSYGDSGTYSRFFLIPKAARSDREPVLGGLEVERDMNGSPVRNARCTKCGRVKFAAADARCQCAEPEWTASSSGRANSHPTVKPVDLMRHLVRLVTPPGGTVLDPFLGSGTTALAAEMEGFAWVGIEKEAEYVRIAEARLNGTQRGMAL
jgi:site-specific DNA-methyltransferase (adenine-specific)